MRDITFIFAYYDNPAMLQMQYKAIENLPAELKSHVRTIVVDDGSPNTPARPPSDWTNWYVDDTNRLLSIYRMLEDVRWNQDACRNLAVNLAKTEWVLLTDIDHLVPEETFRRLITGRFDDDVAYQFTRQSRMPDGSDVPYKLHPNTWFMTRRLFEHVGGYDERFAGWYGTDGDFRARVIAKADLIHLPEYIVRIGREIVPDASTTVYERKTAEDGENIKRIKKERDQEKNWTTLRFQFPWKRVF